MCVTSGVGRVRERAATTRFALRAMRTRELFAHLAGVLPQALHAIASLSPRHVTVPSNSPKFENWRLVCNNTSAGRLYLPRTGLLDHSPYNPALSCSLSHPSLE